MSLLSVWVDHAVMMARRPAEFYTGARKIHTGVTLEFPTIDESLDIEDCGFTKMKLSMLRRLYWSAEHAEQVAELWRARVDKGKYGSISVSTYHHLTKSDPAKRSKRASVMGPCLVGVSFTLLPPRRVAVDAFYRTTELFKKFPADLVFIRDTILPSMGVEQGSVERLRCHFANVTSHTMYWVTVMPHLEDPIGEWERIRSLDERFWVWSLKWCGRYMCEEYAHGIAKFAQAKRVQMDALNRTTGHRLELIQRYIRDNHPGYRGDAAEQEDEE